MAAKPHKRVKKYSRQVDSFILTPQCGSSAILPITPIYNALQNSVSATFNINCNPVGGTKKKGNGCQGYVVGILYEFDVRNNQYVFTSNNCCGSWNTPCDSGTQRTFTYLLNISPNGFYKVEMNLYQGNGECDGMGTQIAGGEVEFAITSA